MSLAGGSLSILHQGNTLFFPAVYDKGRPPAFADVTEKVIMTLNLLFQMERRVS